MGTQKLVWFNKSDNVLQKLKIPIQVTTVGEILKKNIHSFF
jgi:hypothetical protein